MSLAANVCSVKVDSDYGLVGLIAVLISSVYQRVILLSSLGIALFAETERKHLIRSGFHFKVSDSNSIVGGLFLNSAPGKGFMLDQLTYSESGLITFLV